MNGCLGLPRSTRCFTILVGPRWDRLPFKSATEETPGPAAPDLPQRRHERNVARPNWIEASCCEAKHRGRRNCGSR